jgi:peptidoglycan/xylan/chitin deacetylase (PgdA/CDA1 family)
LLGSEIADAKARRDNGKHGLKAPTARFFARFRSHRKMVNASYDKAAALTCIVAGVSISAAAETCPGNPDALGTSRVLTINPGEFSLLGTMQYQQTLPLGDREVVITFDDGPRLPYSSIILDTLA